MRSAPITFGWRHGHLRRTILKFLITASQLICGSTAKAVQWTVLTEGRSEYLLYHGVPDGSADTTQKGKVVVDAGSSLNVRKAPSVNADVVGSLYKDDIVTIISETSGWYQIVTSTGVSAEYIQKI